MSGEKNIFETAAKQLGRKKAGSDSSKQKSHPKTSYKDPETQEMLKKIKDMKENLQNKVDVIKSKTGPKAEYFKKILENKYSLSPKERSEIELAKKVLGDKVWKSLGKSKSDEAAPAPTSPNKRKAKTLGIRKKWIPMR
jgi:hypothetical protein